MKTYEKLEYRINGELIPDGMSIDEIGRLTQDYTLKIDVLIIPMAVPKFININFIVSPETMDTI